MAARPGASHVQGRTNGNLLEEFQLVRILGSGGFGVAIRAKNNATDEDVAVKVIPEDNNNSNWSLKSLHNEVNIISQRLPKHPNVVEYKSCWKERLDTDELATIKSLVGRTVKLSTNNASLSVICIEMELCSCNLRSWFKSRQNGINAATNFKVFGQLVDGLEHIHKSNLIHRDLKPTNIFIYTGGINPIVKIGDFGLAVLHNSPSGMEYHTTNAGNALYKAPEQEGRSYGHAVDIYALGLILYELFDRNAQVDVQKSLTRLKYKKIFPDDLERKFPEVAKLILEMIEYEPEERPNFLKIRQIISTRSAGQASTSEEEGDDNVEQLEEILDQVMKQFKNVNMYCRNEAYCKGCKRELKFPRYKCCVCDDFFICQFCEDRTEADLLTLPGHSAGHHMLKIKKCLTCNKYHWCRFCHDEAEKGHTFDRFEVGLVKCGSCSTSQMVENKCRKCGIRFAQYFCSICHLYDDTPNAVELTWHCGKCGICRKKAAADLEYEHCDDCGMCFPASTLNHDCKPNSGKSSCSFCHEKIFDSRWPALLISCGHYIHQRCAESFIDAGAHCVDCNA